MLFCSQGEFIVWPLLPGWHKGVALYIKEYWYAVTLCYTCWHNFSDI